MTKFKPYILTIVLALVAVAIVSRVAFVRKIVTGATA